MAFIDDLGAWLLLGFCGLVLAVGIGMWIYAAVLGWRNNR